MTILDSKGRLFGKLSLIDLGAALVILLVIIGIFVIPGPSGSLAQVTTTQPIEVDVLVRGLSIRDPDILLETFEETPQTNIIVRNQPSGSVEIKNVELIDRQIIVTQPDGTVITMPDPRTSAELFSHDLLFTLTGQAEITPNGPVLKKSQVKIGTSLELDGNIYNFRGSIIDVRLDAED
ncbi:DUF4330 domain-containing protein [Spirulina sp. CS-785/01]|uniref:DUF4330 domain-containing protein n=1 Tax=Spirulina sp. CS-785/01 TaxID=3021716 RepID=UPI00232F6DCE|nr:DUF4330 domain-containing protein [Spirulina sp. CS-785/01]MDB9311831.1 DUF4330 domain-containing protein [Spirulina sp. CS-785/01]